MSVQGSNTFALTAVWPYLTGVVELAHLLSRGGGGIMRRSREHARVKTSALHMSGYLDGVLKFWAGMHSLH